MAAENSLWEIVELSKAHRRDQFDCGSVPLNTFVRQYARQNTDKGIARTFVAQRHGELLVRGYYTLAASSVAFEHVPPQLKLPRYPIPMVHLARLAVDNAEKGKGLGEFLSMNAFSRVLAIADQLGVFAIDVTAKDDSARSFYERYGFTSLLDDPNHMFISVIAVKKAFVG